MGGKNGKKGRKHLGMPKNGQMKAGWETCRSFLTFLLTHKKKKKIGGNEKYCSSQKLVFLVPVQQRDDMRN